MSPLFNLVSAGGIPKATYTATTGSPTIDTSTRAGKTIIKYTGSGSITIGTGGTCEVLVVAGGGAGSNNTSGAGGGAGGYYYNTSFLIPSGTLTVTVGAGGTITSSVAAPGLGSAIGGFGVPGGGAAMNVSYNIINSSAGGSGAGSGSFNQSNVITSTLYGSPANPAGLYGNSGGNGATVASAGVVGGGGGGLARQEAMAMRPLPLVATVALAYQTQSLGAQQCFMLVAVADME
jgi:hypothetical protein